MPQKKSIFVCLFSFILPLQLIAQEDAQDSYIQSLASLSYYTRELQVRHPTTHDILFSQADLDPLWETVAINSDPAVFEKAYADYNEGQKLILQRDCVAAIPYFKEANSTLESLWKKAINDFGQQIILKSYDPLLQNPHLPKKVSKGIKHYVIPKHHPMRGPLEAIFTASRATANEKAFAAAGFSTIGEKRPRTFMIVARHPALPGHLVKVCLDNEHRLKQKKPTWKWLVQRCKGAKKIRDIIKEKHFKYFTVADKWIYPLPASPRPLKSKKVTDHHAILLVTDMNLTSFEVNVHAWSHVITKEHLDELYYIITHGGGSSYRPDNIAYTHNGTFAFIDTEYPDRSPDYERIRKYLSPEMLKYWDRLVKKGGK